MKLETKSGGSTAEIIGYLNDNSEQPILVILTDKKSGWREVQNYTKDLKFFFGDKESCLDLTEVKNENNES